MSVQTSGDPRSFDFGFGQRLLKSGELLFRTGTNRLVFLSL